MAETWIVPDRATLALLIVQIGDRGCAEAEPIAVRRPVVRLEH